ncbi:GlxA family transcriptional regulator [Caulobacter sp. 17J80-11]|uniref:GlxA family transcriptional regulator n=1 Tax=Caulobacter sp. 17J80-11 TaxID=2763502 RepID=UPI001653CE78|nr:GlxA family transcriptional regulator [Caulobacter sp. 17J80-11]MBC6982200.1 GlxA family transcriptional regulator [Caulobacter sp. 17J80-11]
MHRITFLLYDGFQILDATGPAAVFEIAGDYGGAYAVTFASVAGGLVRSSGGLTVATVPLAEAKLCDTLIVPGAELAHERAADADLQRAVAEAAEAGRRVASVCSGAFVLAAAGVLEGRRAATHWLATAGLKRRHPGVRVDEDSIFVEDRGVWSSAGVLAGVDLALAMVGRDYGEAVARQTARKLVVYHRRPGGQSQHSALLEMVAPDNRFAPLLGWARERLDEPLPVERLAEQAALSVRQFTRAFTEATGVAPAKAVERLRVEAARAALETGAGTLDQVARQTGFGNPERMRRAFVKLTGRPPGAARLRAAPPRPPSRP